MIRDNQVARARPNPTRPLRVKKAGGRCRGSRVVSRKCCRNMSRTLKITAPE